MHPGSDMPQSQQRQEDVLVTIQAEGDGVGATENEFSEKDYHDE